MDKLNITNEIGVIFIALIVAYFIYRAYAYLGDLDSCKCAPQSIVQNLKMIELYYLMIILGGILFNLIYLIFNIDYSKLVSKYKYLVGFIILYVVSLIAVYVYYIYNVIEFRSKLDPSCKCANQWQNNIMYLHVLYLTLPIIFILLSALFKFEINTSVLTLVFVSLVAIYLYEKFLIGDGKLTESMKSMLGNYSDMVFEPTIYNQNGLPYENPDNSNVTEFSPNVAQPLQQFRQLRPDEYPVAPDNDTIQTPLSSHEAIVKEYRSKMPNIVYS